MQHIVCQGCRSYIQWSLHCGGHKQFWMQKGEHPCSSPRYTFLLNLLKETIIYITVFTNDFISAWLDTPGEPVGPITFSNISEGKITLSWRPPENDGCSEISHFIIEKRETAKISWALVSDECKQCTFNATKLMKTNEYQFRVSAVNKFGVGRALESTPIIAQLQYSRLKFI